MRRSSLGITHTKHIKFKIKKSILLAVFSLIFVAFGGSNVSALDLSAVSIEVTAVSPTTQVHSDGIDINNLRVTPELEFNRLNDFISYKLVFKNNDGKKFRIIGITDDNSNDAIELTYSYPTELDTNNKAVNFTIKYVKIATAPLKTINLNIKIVDEDDASQIIPIVIPNTGVNTAFDAASAATVQSIIIYIAFAGICLAIYIIVKRRKTKEDEKAELRVPKTMLVLALLLGIVPVAVIAASFENIHFTVSLVDVQLNGPYEVTFDTGEGGTPIPPQIVNKGETIDPPATPPERKGYDFAGWIDENGDPFVFTNPVTGPVTVKAKWNLKTYNISYDLADDITDPATVSGNPTTYNVETASITLNNPTREHYDFTGWTGTDLAGPTMTVTIPKGSINDRSYTATWKVKEYKATFDTDGGTPAIEDQTKKYGETFTEPSLTATIKKGYDLVEWQLNGAAYDFSTPVSADIELKAKWSIINYDINYDWDGGTPTANPATYTVEDTFTLINPTKHAYDFLGWVGSNNDQPETTVTVAKGTTGELYFDAVWEPTTYTITYEGGGTANPANRTTYTIETPTFKLTNPTKDGAVFKGWTWPGMTTPQMNVEISQGTSGDLTYMANWHEILTVTYDVNGGSAVSPASFTVESGNEIGTLASTNKDYYDFLGWYLGDTKIESDYIVRDNITIKAKWKPTEYSINYVLGENATVNPANPTTYNIETPDFTLNNPKRAGHRFLGWTRGAGGTPEMTVTVTQGTTGELHFNAHWQDLAVVEFDPNGGTYPNPDALELDPGSEIGTLPVPTRDGYNFEGWYLGAQKIESDYVVNDDITLVAKWSIITYNITYDLADDSTDPATVSGNPDTYDVETADITLNNPTREHYDFTGWTGTDLAGPTMTVKISTGSTGARSYTATWKEKEYTATFNTDGGTPATIDSQTKKYGETFTAPTTTITKDGYNLVGWLLNGADYDFATPASADIELKAKWEAIPYDITYDLADDTTDPATVSGNPATYTVEDTITLNNPTRDHYDFTGWTGTDLSAPTMTVTISAGSTGARSYTATWKKKEYTATFKDGDIVITTQTKEYNELFTEPTKPTKTGYDFVEWQLNNVAYNFNTPATANIELKAVWTPTIYNITYDTTGGTIDENLNPKTYTIEDTFTLQNPTMAGHKFKGWTIYNNIGQQPQNPMTITAGTTTGDLDFIAHWVGLVTVTFDSGVPGMVITPDAIELEKDSSLPALPQPTREHYTFGGWFNGTTEMKEGDKVSTDVDLVAKWIPVPYPITYNYDGGDAVNQSTYTIEDTFTLNNPTKTGFEFDGWTGTGLNAMTKDVTVPVGSSGARSYTAHWTEIFTVTFNGNGGTPASTTVDVRDGETVAEPAEPTRTDYVFKGWKLNGADYNFNTPVKGDITLKAEWQVGKSTLSLDGKGMSLKMKQLANPTSGITNGYNYTDTRTKAFARATEAQYNAAMNAGLVTNANKISTDGSIAATYMWFDSRTGTMYYYTEAAKIYVNGSMDRMFAKYTNITDWSGLEDFDTSGATAMDRLFQDCPSFDDAALEYIKDWDTSNVTDMTFIFGANNASSGGNKITKLTALTNWDVSKVRSFYQAFKHATKLESLGELVDDPKNPGTQIYNGLGQWNVSSVGYEDDTSVLPSNDNFGFAQMFNGCTSLTDADAIVDWDINNAITSAVNAGKNRSWAFDGMLRNAPVRPTQPAFTSWAPGGSWSDTGTFNPNAAP